MITYCMECLKCKYLPCSSSFRVSGFFHKPPGDTCVWTQFSRFPYEPPGGWWRPARRRILCCPVCGLWWFLWQLWCPSWSCMYAWV